jgi:hypothetical protein
LREDFRFPIYSRIFAAQRVLDPGFFPSAIRPI